MTSREPFVHPIFGAVDVGKAIPLPEPTESGTLYAWTCPACGTPVSTVVRLRVPVVGADHGDCGDRCACYQRGVDDEYDATHD
jgi:hypothetical protein